MPIKIYELTHEARARLLGWRKVRNDRSVYSLKLSLDRVECRVCEREIEENEEFASKHGSKLPTKIYCLSCAKRVHIIY